MLSSEATHYHSLGEGMPTFNERAELYTAASNKADGEVLV